VAIGAQISHSHPDNDGSLKRRNTFGSTLQRGVQMSAPSTNPNTLRTVAPSGSSVPADRLAGQAQDALLLIGRVLMAYIFMKSGFGKLMDIGGFSASLASKGVPMASMLGVIGPCVEFFGGLAILTGFRIRYTAPLMALFTVVATGISHRYLDVADAAMRRAQETNFDKNVCMIGGFVVLMAAGAGRFSLDGLRRR
jgi:putative oxidoreductase